MSRRQTSASAVASPAPKTSSPDYGFCPVCGEPGETRERRPFGNDTCRLGHLYPSKDARYFYLDIVPASPSPAPDPEGQA